MLGLMHDDPLLASPRREEGLEADAVAVPACPDGKIARGVDSEAA